MKPHVARPPIEGPKDIVGHCVEILLESAAPLASRPPELNFPWCGP